MRLCPALSAVALVLGPTSVAVGSVAAIAGALTLSTATFFHPLDADPNDPEAAFAEYAADRFWVASHLGQFLGVGMLGAGLVALAGVIEPGRASAWARIGVVWAAASIAAAAALQAVDGVALKVMVDRWAAAPGEARPRAFEAAFAVRQIEIGFVSLLSLVFGPTFSAFGIALFLSTAFPRWLGVLAIAGGVATLASGIAQAYTGFSSLAMMLSMPAGFLLLVWAILTGAAMWRMAPRLSDGAGEG